VGFSHGEKLLVKDSLKATVVPHFQLTVEDEMKTLPHRVYVTCRRDLMTIKFQRLCSDTAMVSAFMETYVVSEFLSRVKQRKQENLLLLSAC
jgi:hypothetical protein